MLVMVVVVARESQTTSQGDIFHLLILQVELMVQTALAISSRHLTP